MKLPFLIVHGALVWKVALVVLTAATCFGLPGLRPRRREEARAVMAAALVATFWLLVMAGVGRCAMATDHHALAAATPWHRTAALDELEERAAHPAIGREDRFQRLIALRSLRGECSTQLLLERERFEDVLVDDCASIDDRAKALALLGRYAEAAAFVDPRSDLGIRLSILTGRWGLAAATVEEPCLRDLFAHFAAGHGVNGIGLGATCTGSLAAFDLAVAGDAPLVGTDLWESDPHQLLRPTGLGALWMLAHRAGNASDADPYVRSSEYAAAATVAISRGELVTAQHDVDVGRSIAPASRRVARAAALLSLVDPTRPMPTAYRELFIYHLDAYLPGCDDAFTPALAAAGRGDGTPLVAYLSRCDVDDSDRVLVWSVLPRVVEDRAELAEIIQSFHCFLPYRTYDAPFHSVACTFLKREDARQLGDADGVARYGATMARLTAPFDDVRVPLALSLLRDVRFE